MSSPPKKVVVVGAGPVGSLTALYFSHAGWSVDVYELRGDLRRPENRAAGTGRSINLALSHRGITSLRDVGDGGALLEQVLAETIPMYGRMIHSGKVGEPGESQNYDVHGRFNSSIDRALLNMQLLDALEARENVRVFFEHKLLRMRLDAPDGNELEFENRGGAIDGQPRIQTVKCDLVAGTDGAHSTVRRMMQKYIRMDYAQTYIDTLWCEFTIPPHPSTGDFQLSPNHLHIWPKQTYMFIAIPSIDRSFTCTLFLPTHMYASIGDSRERLLAFFATNFPDVIAHIGPASLCDQYLANQHLPLISIKCGPYHFSDRCVVLGDAAHAMVPFYGQGMNAGFESVARLFAHLRAHSADDGSGTDVAAALAAYTAERQPDAHAICDLAMRNYEEMRAAVTSRAYLARKAIEETTYKYTPRLGIRTLYSLVSFSNERYSTVIRRTNIQARWENRLMVGLAGAVVLAAAWRAGAQRHLGEVLERVGQALTAA